MDAHAFKFELPDSYFLHQNAARGEFVAGGCYSFFATSGVLMSEFFEGLPLDLDIT